MPFFTVIIPTYNRSNTVTNSIESVLNQTYKDFELIIVDDGSTDTTSSVLNRYSDSILYLSQSNSGVSSARNTGIRKSGSPFISFLDSDDIWSQDKLQEQYRFIKENPEVKIHQTDEIWIRNGRRVNPMNKHGKKSGMIFLESLELCIISPSSVVLDRELFEKYGFFDEKLPVCEDYDMWLRITCYEKVGLIRKKLITKFGGHESQLSHKYWGMDRFRVYSIIKLLKDGNPENNSGYYKKAKETALSKCGILREGALKRDKSKFAAYLEKIIERLKSEDYSNINYETLLKG